jgi:hypothetical protein
MDAMVAVTGDLHPSVIIEDNYPHDAIDGYELINLTGLTTLDLSGCRSTLIEVGSTGAVTMTAITARRDGDVFSLIGTDGNVTIQHNAGVILKGGANITLAGGDVLTLRRHSGIWREISRSKP